MCRFGLIPLSSTLGKAERLALHRLKKTWRFAFPEGTGHDLVENHGPVSCIPYC